MVHTGWRASIQSYRAITRWKLARARREALYRWPEGDTASWASTNFLSALPSPQECYPGRKSIQIAQLKQVGGLFLLGGLLPL